MDKQISTVRPTTVTQYYARAVQNPLKDHCGAPGSLKPSMIVLHITEGSTASGAIATFASSVAPHRVSAHFVIGRSGTVYQCVPLDCAAWHASEVNGHAIGIEHVAIAGKMFATEEQYVASSRLVDWLCRTFAIPCDRDHIKTHNEASPKDGHVLCCTGALNPDRVVNMAAALGAWETRNELR